MAVPLGATETVGVVWADNVPLRPGLHNRSKDVEAKLDYLVNLGVTAVWISPVVLNANAEYHGYAARDFFKEETRRK